ncbi:LIC_12616 family protein [Allopusillimonas ginsengisoli]|uniref:phage neck terminator protein n=1 Tax=Allopusillimonas ginsengisoli TaxID=453575 RepID=UPI0039C23506
MTDIELYKLLRPAVKTASGVPMVIQAVQNAPAPGGSYATIHVRTDIGERGMAFKDRKLLPDNETFEHTIRSQQEVTCTVEFYRARAKEYAANMLQLDKRDDIYWPLYKAGLCIMATGKVLDLTALQSDQYEERARVDIYLRMEVSRKYNINRIMEVTGTVQNEDGDDLQSVTVKA